MKLLGWLVVIVGAVAAGAWLGFQPERSGTWQFWAMVGAPSVVFGAISALRARADGELRDWLVPKWGDFSRGFLVAALLFAGAWAFKHMAAAQGSPREIWFVSLYAQIGDPRELQARPALVGAVIVLLSIAEELLWRGHVTRLLEERFGSRRAWILSAVLYAVAHVPTAWALRAPGGGLNPLLPMAALGCGLAWGALARWQGRLPPAIISHALFDWVVVMMFPLWGIHARPG
jgi:hypothetical protein